MISFEISEQTVEDYRHELVERRNLAWQVARENLAKAKRKEKQKILRQESHILRKKTENWRSNSLFTHSYAPEVKCSKLFHLEIT